MTQKIWLHKFGYINKYFMKKLALIIVFLSFSSFAFAYPQVCEYIRGNMTGLNAVTYTYTFMSGTSGDCCAPVSGLALVETDVAIGQSSNHSYSYSYVFISTAQSAFCNS